MSVTEAVKQIKRKEQFSLNRREIFLYITNFILGVIFSFSGFSVTFSPFGVSFCASAGKRHLIISALGAALGYILCGDSICSLRYIATILALIVILSALKPFKEIRDNMLTPVISTFVCLFVTGLALAFSEKISVFSLLLCFSESLLGSALTYLFKEVRGILSLKSGFSSLTSKEAIALIISFSLLLLALKDINAFNVFPAHIIATVIILICGKRRLNKTLLLTLCFLPISQKLKKMEMKWMKI